MAERAAGGSAPPMCTADLPLDMHAHDEKRGTRRRLDNFATSASQLAKASRLEAAVKWHQRTGEAMWELVLVLQQTLRFHDRPSPRACGR